VGGADAGRFGRAGGGKFNAEIAPIEIPGRKGPTVFEKDEHNRPDATLESLAKLKPAFRKDGTITAGNAPGLNSGAAGMIVADAHWAEKRGLTPMARLVAFGVGAVEPGLFGLGPVPAVRQAWIGGEAESQNASRSTRPSRQCLVVIGN